MKIVPSAFLLVVSEANLIIYFRGMHGHHHLNILVDRFSDFANSAYKQSATLQ